MVTKVCYKCKEELPVELFCLNRTRKDGHADACKKCKRLDDKWYQERNKDKCKIVQHKNYLRNREVIIARTCAYSKNNRERCNTWSTKARNKLKTEVFSHYCNGDIVCAWCKKERDVSLLTIDHILGGGNKQRKSVGIKPGYSCYQWLKKNNFPAGYQVLCWNCQYRKRAIEVAPVNPTKRQLQKVAYRKLVKSQCLEQYGSVCPCGETDQDVLTLDHVNDDGARHRRELEVRGFNFYIHLRKNGFPNTPPLQVLCLSCQYRKRNNEERKGRPATNYQGAAVIVSGV